MSHLRQKILSGVFWQGLSNVGNYGLGFVISLILARLLTPEAFGTIAIIGVFVALFGVFIDSGLTAALVQKKELTPEDCSSVFFLNLIMAIGLYVLLFCFAPWIATFYARPELTACIRVLSLTLIISAFSMVQGTMIYREMQFQLNFRIALIGLLISGTVGVVLAYRGFGVWALIVQQVLKAALTCIMQWCWGHWRPIFKVNFSSLSALFRFGWKMFCSGVLDTIYNNLYPLLIGKLFQLETLSFYNRGNHIPSLGMNIVNSTVGSVLFPAFSQVQDDREKKHQIMRKAVQNIMFIVVPCMGFLFVSATPLVRVLYGEQWIPCVPFLKIFCFVFLLWPLHTINLQLLTACGRSDVFLTIEILKKIQLIAIILCTYRHGPLAMAEGLILSGCISFVENSWMSRKLAGYGILSQIKDLLVPTGLCVIAGGAAWMLTRLSLPAWLLLLSEACVFSMIYLGLAWIFKMIPSEMIHQIQAKNPFRKEFVR